MTTRSLLRTAVIYVPVAVLLALVGPYVFLWSRFPDPIATHWSGAPNGSMPRFAALALPVALWLFFAGRAGWPTLKHTAWDEPPGEPAPNAVPPLRTLYFVAGVLLFAQASIVWANLDAPHWTAAKHVETLPAILGVFAVGTLLAGCGRLIERKLEVDEGQSPVTPEPLELHAPERVLWWAHATNHWLLGLSVVGALFVYLTSAQPTPPLIRIGVPILILVIGLLFSTVHVVAGNDDVTIELGVWRWPRKSVSIRDIEDVEVHQVQPLRYGGWGYRFCGSGCRAFIIRAGEALLLRQRNGRSLVVTVDDSERGAALIKGLKELAN